MLQSHSVRCTMMCQVLKFSKYVTQTKPVRTSVRVKVSERIIATDAPIIVKTKRLMAATPGAVSLAQGIVHWQPPPNALKAASDLLLSGASELSGYGPAEGLPALRQALKAKIASKNGLQQHEVMVTAGANQAVLNAILALVDEGDCVMLFRPMYFNHLMAIQMSGGGRNVEYGECDNRTFHPDLKWLRQRLLGQKAAGGGREGKSVRMVIITNPCNPTGVLMTKEEVDEAADICREAGCWLILDNTYEDFVYGSGHHYSSPLPHVVHIFSMSKAYGMMGWRIGYLAYHSQAEQSALADQLLKVQDTTIICPPQLSQYVALAALQPDGQLYMMDQIRGLEGNRKAVLDALSPWWPLELVVS
ncbi:hypothetical protein CEUSTIGMA_g734.t1 [Chlamydomonas eustigma]|uniref:Aminotransferase class I/classII large domain-containing protein n=1 Tax=Chlamydomonas eustigma TaxID=1157962 RepID=A0A250WRW1_9CHLO|nr:hypothetical protein CEUSTIGMA_g734.t1 [Chlamydomonas eustigma]|eukprot:GAX73280.1 hypothetical protein CEUSTIGMA_g734.t1 [Chlamydomonas eustigma]